MFSIYILALNEGRYYVGRSLFPYSRIQQHRARNGALCTRQWGVDRVLQVYEAPHFFEEDLKTKELMNQHGIMYVRGGSYCSPTLFRWQLAALQNELDIAMHRCFKCGRPLGQEDHVCCESAQTGCAYCKKHGHRLENCPELDQPQIPATFVDHPWFLSPCVDY